MLTLVGIFSLCFVAALIVVTSHDLSPWFVVGITPALFILAIAIAEYTLRRDR